MARELIQPSSAGPTRYVTVPELRLGLGLDSVWESITLGPGFSSIGAAGAAALLEGGRTTVRGLVNATSTALAVNLLIATLPDSKFFPPHPRRKSVQVISSGGGDPTGVIEIRANGQIVLVNGPATAGNVLAISLDVEFSIR